MRKTLYISDLDGTLLGDDSRLSATTTAILNHLIGSGVLFTCVTGRPFASAAVALAPLHLRLPLAAYNGAAIVDPASGQVLEACVMERERLQPLVEGLRALKHGPMVFALREDACRLAWMPHLATEALRRYVENFPAPEQLAPETDHDGLFSGQIYLVTFRGNARQLAVARCLVEEDRYLTHYYQADGRRPGEYWLEVNRFDGDKAGAVGRLKRLTGADEIVCFGDNVNDLPMFAAADRSYAVANACAEVRAAATGVIGSNNADSVARFIAREYSGENGMGR